MLSTIWSELRFSAIALAIEARKPVTTMSVSSATCSSPTSEPGEPGVWVAAGSGELGRLVVGAVSCACACQGRAAAISAADNEITLTADPPIFRRTTRSSGKLTANFAVLVSLPVISFPLT
jgi:hypothetical protein